MGEKLIPLFQHVVDGYSHKLREEWRVKIEETDIETTQQVKEEPLDNFLVVNQFDHSTNHEVIIILISVKLPRSTLDLLVQGDPKLAPPLGRKSRMTWSLSDQTGLKYNLFK